MTDSVVEAKMRAKAAVTRWREARRGVNDPTFVPTRLDQIVEVAEHTIASINQDVVTEVEALIVELSTLRFPVDADENLSTLEQATFALDGSLGRLSRAASRAGFSVAEDDLNLPPGVRVPVKEIAEQLESFVAAIEGVRPALDMIGRAQAADMHSDVKQNALLRDLLDKAAIKIEIIGVKTGKISLIDVSGLAALAHQLVTLLKSFVTTIREATDRLSLWLSQEADPWIGAAIAPVEAKTAALVKGAAIWIRHRAGTGGVGSASEHDRTSPSATVVSSDQISTDEKLANPSQVTIARSLNDLSDLREGPLSILDNLIGMESVRGKLEDLRNLLSLEQEQRRRGQRPQPMALNVALYGQAGTGKTEVARAIAQIYRDAGILPGPFICCSPLADLVGEYIGQTAVKTRSKCMEALGGVLYVDEAYLLARGGQHDFGAEAISELLDFMVSNRDRIAVIVAGYPELMRDFFRTNAGLLQRFTHHITMPEYTDEQLVEILILCARARRKSVAYEARLVIREKIATYRQHCAAAQLSFSFAADAINFLEKANLAQTRRLLGRSLAAISDDEISHLTVQDFETAEFNLPR